MEITLNNQKQNITEGVSLQAFVLEQLGDKQKGIAVAINNSVIPKQAWEQTFINNNDNILIIKATQGG
ncbi:MAG TPA: sulfur carrier protein ThiS [Bacteroidia bacterium]|nr:sulfur carrier protein ThiS [Bacteroidia bacterium]